MPAGGFGLDDILSQKYNMHRFHGIRNAIDDEWDPGMVLWQQVSIPRSMVQERWGEHACILVFISVCRDP